MKPMVAITQLPRDHDDDVYRAARQENSDRYANLAADPATFLRKISATACIDVFPVRLDCPQFFAPML